MSQEKHGSALPSPGRAGRFYEAWKRDGKRGLKRMRESIEAGLDEGVHQAPAPRQPERARGLPELFPPKDKK